jgi:hypothetical protein
MKPQSLLIYFLVLTVLTASMCKKKPVDPIDQLPPETQTGANTFGCLVNGEVLIPKGSSLSGPNLACIYQYLITGTPAGYTFALGATDKKDPCNIKTVGFGFDSVVMKRGIYLLRLRKNGQGGGAVRMGMCNMTSNNFDTNESITGELNLKNFDEANQVASGTFWFNAINSNGDTIKVTNGRFDMHYTR